MVATFDPALGTVRDRLRFRLGDTDTAAALIQDETYSGLLTYYEDDESQTLRALAQNLIIYYGQQVTKFSAGGGVSFEWGERVRIWREIVWEMDAALGLGPSVVLDLALYPEDPYSVAYEEEIA